MERISNADSMEALSATLSELCDLIATRQVSVTKAEVLTVGKEKRMAAPHLWTRESTFCVSNWI